MRHLLIRLALAILQPFERAAGAYLRRAVAEDPAFREWVWSQRPDLDTVLDLRLHEYPQEW